MKGSRAPVCVRGDCPAAPSPAAQLQRALLQTAALSMALAAGQCPMSPRRINNWPRRSTAGLPSWYKRALAAQAHHIVTPVNAPFTSSTVAATAAIPGASSPSRFPRKTAGAAETMTDLPPAANVSAAASALALVVPAAALGAGAAIAYKCDRKGGGRSSQPAPDRMEMVQCQEQEQAHEQAQDYPGDLDAVGRQLPADTGERPAAGLDEGRALSPASIAALTESRSGSTVQLQSQET